MKRFLLASALAAGVVSSVQSQTIIQPSPSSIEDAVALQIGRYQLMIAKQNTLIQTLQKKVTDLTEKCGEACKEKADQPKPKVENPNAPEKR